MTYNPSSFKELTNLIGDEPVQFILYNAKSSNISKQVAGNFAHYLHPHAYGEFRNSGIPYGGEAMKLILSIWYERKCDENEVTREQAIEELTEALSSKEGADKPR